MRKGDKMSEETKRKISLATKGVKKSLEMRKKLSQWHLKHPMSEEHKRKSREAHVSGMLGKKHKPETILKMKLAAKGRVISVKQRLKISGKNNWNWKGGITPKNKLLRRSKEFIEWRKQVFERDNYTCQECGKRGSELHPDHIKPFAYFPELRFDVNNGRTLCKPCHIKTDSWGHKSTKNYGSGCNHIQQREGIIGATA